MTEQLSKELTDLAAQIRTRLNIDPPNGLLGDGNGTIYDPFVPGSGKVYVRYQTSNGYSLPTLVRGPTSVNVTLQDGLPCLIGKDSAGQDCVLNVDFAGAVAGGYNPIPLPTNNTSPFVTQDALATLRCSQQANPDLTVHVSGWYPITAGVMTGFVGDDIDLSSFVPSTGLHCAVGVFLKNDFLTLEAFASTPVSLTNPLTTVDINQVLASAAVTDTTVWFYDLKAGVSAIHDTDTLMDARQLINIGATGGGTGVTSVTAVLPLHSSGGTTPSITIDTMVGDSGSGGLRGVVPAPASGDATKFLGGDAAWHTIPTGAGSPLTTKGDIYVYSTTNTRQGVGADYSVLMAVSVQATGLAYSSSETNAILLPVGTTLQEPTGASGLIRFNSTTGRKEWWENSAWQNAVRLSGDTMTGALTIQGSSDTTQLAVKSYSTQTSDPVQLLGTGGTVTTRLTQDGRLALNGTLFTAGSLYSVIAADGTLLSIPGSSNSRSTFRLYTNQIITGADQTGQLTSGVTSSPNINQNGFNITTHVGSVISPFVNGSSGTVTLNIGLNLGTGNTGAGTVTNNRIIQIQSAVNSGGGTLTNNAVVAIDAQSAGVNNVSVLLGTTSNPAGNYGIYDATLYPSSWLGSTTVASAAGAVWKGVEFRPATATVTGSTHITTTAGFNYIDIATPTVSAASALTVDIASTVRIAGAPSAGGAGPATITSAYSLWVASGLSRLDGGAIFGVSTGGIISPQLSRNSGTGGIILNTIGGTIGSSSLLLLVQNNASEILSLNGNGILRIAIGSGTVAPTWGRLSASGGHLFDTSASLSGTGALATFRNNGGGTLFSITGNGAYSGTIDTMTYASTISLDVSKGNVHETTTVDATGNATINASSTGTAGQHLWIIIINDATSGKVITFGTNFKSTGMITGTASKAATIHFISDGNNWYEVARTQAL